MFSVGGGLEFICTSDSYEHIYLRTPSGTFFRFGTNVKHQHGLKVKNMVTSQNSFCFVNKISEELALVKWDDPFSEPEKWIYFPPFGCMMVKYFQDYH